ncbi:single-stranded-DNA-specific exonuclease RecJ [Owenweeksia hongkongensis]|uniref:single-stranded-DNA-specific exonuclease RecJ n=1 Tax=Owenweeksia hongkongensis TaxID=253245 RepID=UPI003A90A83D
MNYRWTNAPKASAKITQNLQQQLGINPTLCGLLAQRDIHDFDAAKVFFRPNLSSLHEPFLMKDMDKAVERIEKAIKNEERILIYGDYDVDGTTAVSLVHSFLKNHYPHLDTYIPDRYKEGYGISTAGIDYAADNDISLIIALDCGIKAIDKVEYASSKGIDFIIGDHHRPGDKIPEAVAVLDPKREDCKYPFDELSGCGVGFKLVQALCKKWELPDSEWTCLLDLLAISIGADIVPINGENRVLAFYGLKLINEQPRPGIALLKDLAGKKDITMTITDVVFLLGPRINAAGRISHGHLAVELLTGEDPAVIEELSKTINDHNNERKELDGSITQSALKMIQDLDETDRYSTVVYEKNWHKGVIGIVASRLIENYYRPTVVFTESKGVLAGSARSVKGFDVYNALDSCSDILEQFGGHMYAAGMTLPVDRFQEFKDKFEEVVKSTIKPEQRTPEIEIDATVTFPELTDKFYKVLKQFAPFGPANMQPTFRTDNLSDTGFSKPVGGDGTHLRVVLKDPTSGISFTGIGFGMADKLPLLQSGKPISIVYHIEENHFNGKVTLQIRLKDIKLTEEL